MKVVVTEKQSVQTPSEEKPDGIKFSIGFSEHPAFYDRQFNDRYTDLSFALGNYLLGVLDESSIGSVKARIMSVGIIRPILRLPLLSAAKISIMKDGLILATARATSSPISKLYEYSLSPNCPFIPEWKKQGEDYYREQIESLQWGRDVFVPYLEQHKTLTPEDEKLYAEIMATESDWFRVPEDKEATLAERLVDFAEDVSPYEYMDALEVGETKKMPFRKSTMI